MFNHDHNVDIVSTEIRSRMMRSVRQRDTRAEILVRELVSSLGLRYRLNNKSLPGSPDLSNRSQQWAIFVNGCFWHGHKNCPKTKSGKNVRIPVSNDQFWRFKIADNRKRDARKCRQLRAAGIRIMLIWECQLRDPNRILERIRLFVYGAKGKSDKTNSRRR
jgi:DNA mismatch endonuclease, patch repair protein